MNPVVKEQWLAALRGGQYAQGTGTLRSTNGSRHCCLGVLCDLYDKNHPSATPLLWDGHSWPPGYVLSWAGLPEDDETSDPPSHCLVYALAVMNDEGHSFEHIADCIERQL